MPAKSRPERPFQPTIKPVRATAPSSWIRLHDKVLIVDFGSQVTQLIARRVREEKVYCEIVPYQKAEASLPRDAAEGGDPLRRPGLGAREGRAARAQGDL